MTLNHDNIKQQLTQKFGEVLSFDESYGMLTVVAPAEQNLKLLQFFYENQSLGFRFLTDLTANHYPERKGEELCVVYHLHNLIDNVRLRLKVYVPVEKPDVFTATKLFPGANWMERETYDFFGINFVGHPDLRRILNADEMDYFPMRKEYTLEDPQRTDKDDEMFGR
ncbi:MAG TPA: NADH-quinone oxidoreductase subunit C [Flavipsychrobacter sp.]|nr:NADH-quinone oxidoreductase subunit C [Flavipsychrobacter sp.]